MGDSHHSGSPTSNINDDVQIRRPNKNLRRSREPSNKKMTLHLHQMLHYLTMNGFVIEQLEETTFFYSRMGF